MIEMVTYTTENVSGLDVSSPVRFRGVPVGRVTELRVDPRASTIEIDFEVFLDRLNTIGANVERIRQTADIEGMFPTLRAQVVGNPVTGEAYLLLDTPENPPPPLALGFTPDRAYIPSMPTPLAAMRDRVPEVLERAEATLQVLREIVSRIPGSLDRSDRFFTNVERIIQQSNLPALSADSRKFFATTSAQIEQIASELEAVIGTRGTLVTFVDEARAASQGRGSSGHESIRARRGGTDHARGRRSAALAAGHSGFARPAARARAAAPGAARVGRLWSPAPPGKR